MHDVRREVHAAVLIVELVQRHESVHVLPHVLAAELVVLQQEPRQSTESLCLQQIEPRNGTELCEVEHHRVQVYGHRKVVDQLWASLPVQEGVYKHDKHRQLWLASMLHHEYVDVRARGINLLRLWPKLGGPRLGSRGRCLPHFIWLVHPLLLRVELLPEVLDLVLVCGPNIVYHLALLHLLDVFCDRVLFVLVDLLHGGLEQTCRESRHVTNRAVHEEFLDDLLVGEDLAEPDAKLNVLLESSANDAYEVRYLGTDAGAESYRQGECDDVFEHFKLIAFPSRLLHNLKVTCLCLQIVLVDVEITVAENLKRLLKEVLVENESREPESPVLLQNRFMDGWRDLDLGGNCLRQSADVELSGAQLLVGSRLLVLQDRVLVLSELMELILIYEAVSLVDQDVRALRLDSTLLLQELLHCGVVLVTRQVHLPVLILAAEGLCWDVIRVEVIDQSVVELIPVILSARLSVLDECVVMAGVRCTIVNYHALQLVLVVLLRHLLVESHQLVFVEVLCGEILLFHQLLEIFLGYFVLTVGSHVQLHRERAIVIDLDLGHGVEVELKAFEL